MNATNSTTMLRADIDRREVLRFAIAAALLGVSWTDRAEATVPTPPKIILQANSTGDGVISGYGEVRVAKLGGTVVPILVRAAEGLAELNLTGRTAYIRYGTGASAITVSSAGIYFGATGRQIAWSRDAFAKLIAAISQDAQKARGAARLRSAMLMSYPAAVIQMKASPDGSVMKLMAKSAAGVGMLSIARCSTTTITDTVYDTVTRTVEVWRSAESQYRECYDREVVRSPCKDVLFAKSVCAATICAAKGFVDMLVSTYEVVEQIAREVVRTVVTCARPLVGHWPDPLDVLRTIPGKYSVAHPHVAFSSADVRAANGLLKSILGGLATSDRFIACLLGGQWSLAGLDTRIDFGNGTVVVPYGVKVCMTRDCATRFSAVQIAAELTSSFESLIGVLVVLFPAYATTLMSIGIAVSPPTWFLGVPLAAAAAPVVAACATVMLAFMILVLIYGTAIIGQMTVWQAAGQLDSNGDGLVCIEHPSFALALLSAALLGSALPALVPPIVNPA